MICIVTWEDLQTARNATYKTNFMEDLHVGDTVWMHGCKNHDGHQVQSKLDSNWIGPYVIMEKAASRDDEFKLCDMVTLKTVKDWVHRRFLSKCYLNRPPHNELKEDCEAELGPGGAIRG